MAAIAALAGSAGAQEKIRIGASTPITGPVAYGALQERRGLDLALREINQGGGVLGRQLELVYEDNQCNPSVSVNVTNKLIDGGVPVIIGAQCSSAVLAAMPVLLRAKIPMLSSIATNPKISEQAGAGGNPWVFRLNPSDRELSVANAKYLKSLGNIRKIAILAESTDYGRGGAEAFSTAAKANGLEVVSIDFHQLGAPDFTTVIAKLRNNGAQAVAIYQAPGDNVNFARQALAQGLTATMTGKINFDGDVVAELIRQGAYKGANTSYPYSPAVDTPENKAFASKVMAAYGETSTYETFAGYESLYVLAEAIKRAGRVEPAAIRDELAKTHYRSMMGAVVRFNDHNQAHNNAAVVAIEDGKVVVKNVFPTE